MDWQTIDWQALDRLRSAFLDGTAGAQDYWRDDRDLECYDQTFAQRIRWKWDCILKELRQREWNPPEGTAVDWGCGTGIATRAFLDHFDAKPSTRIVLWDRSPAAMQFAARKTREEFPSINVWLDHPPEQDFGTLLISHVLTELPDERLDDLLRLAKHATTVIWIEPGTYAVSRKLIAAREHLRGPFQVVSPCTHQAACGMLAPDNERHWCHQFAPSPPEVFTDGNWARFAKLAGVDLRSLPVSFLVLDKRPLPAPSDAARVIGRPRVYKAHALVLCCDADGITEHRYTKRDEPEVFRRWKKGIVPSHLPRGLHV